MDDYSTPKPAKSSRKVLKALDRKRSSEKSEKREFLKHMTDKIFSHLNIPSSTYASPLKTKLSKKSTDYDSSEDDDDLTFYRKRLEADSVKKKKSNHLEKKKSRRSSRKYERRDSSDQEDSRAYSSYDSNSRAVKMRKSDASPESHSRNSSRSNRSSYSASSYTKSSSRSSSLNDSIESHGDVENSKSNQRRVKKRRSPPSNQSQVGKISSIENANPSPLHNSNPAASNYFTPTKRVEMDKKLSTSDTTPSSRSAAKASNSFYEKEIEKHRKFISKATEDRSSSFIRKSFSGFVPPLATNITSRGSGNLPPLATNSNDDFSNNMSPLTTHFKNTAEDNVFSPKSANSVAGGMSNSPRKFYSAEKSHRLSERFTTSTAPSSDSARYYRKRRSQPDMSFSPSIRNRSVLTGQDFFRTEFKSTSFLDYMNENETDCARSVLQTEINSDVPYVDTHCHFDFLFKRMSFYESVDDFYEKTFFKFPENFEGCITDWCQPKLYQGAKSLLNTPTKNFKLWGAFGCHPHFVSDYNDIVEKQIDYHISNYDNVIAWGEMGLDYSDRFGKTDHNLQQSIFIRQLQQACRRNLPIVIHCRDADPDLLRIMKEYVPHYTKIHRHCLTTEEKDVHGLLEHFPNCYVGFTNLLTNRSAYRPRDAVAKIPLERIVLETDAPYFIPQCVTAVS